MVVQSLCVAFVRIGRPCSWNQLLAEGDVIAHLSFFRAQGSVWSCQTHSLYVGHIYEVSVYLVEQRPSFSWASSRGFPSFSSTSFLRLFNTLALLTSVRYSAAISTN